MTHAITKINAGTRASMGVTPIIGATFVDPSIRTAPAGAQTPTSA
jgi:hypothetical protein